MERKFQLKQYINVPTRITHKVKNTIDLIFSDMDRIAEFGVLENSMIADHLPIYIIRKKTRTVRSFSYTYGRSYKNYNKEIFQHHILNNMMWKSFWIKTNDSELLWQIMLSIIQEACDSICPIRKIKLRNNTPAWFTNEIVDMIITKQGRFKRYKESSAEEDWNNFVESRKHLRRALVHANRTVVMESLRENQNNPKRFWRTINYDLGIGKKATSCSQSFDKITTEEGCTIEGQDACEYMNNYYALNGE